MGFRMESLCGPELSEYVSGLSDDYEAPLVQRHQQTIQTLAQPFAVVTDRITIFIA